jgi:hypothetical protein
MESGLHEIDHYLDVFLFAGADKTSNCSKLMNTFTEVCSQLGFLSNGEDSGTCHMLNTSAY